MRIGTCLIHWTGPGEINASLQGLPPKARKSADEVGVDVPHGCGRGAIRHRMFCRRHCRAASLYWISMAQQRSDARSIEID
jgi:hypothetical protein